MSRLVVVIVVVAAWPASSAREVPRVRGLTYAEFKRRASIGEPMVLEDAATDWPAMGWNSSFLSKACGNATFQPKVTQDGSGLWASLRQEGAAVQRPQQSALAVAERSIRLATFLNELNQGECAHKPRYLHDEAVCGFCPGLAQDFSILSYWSTNYLLHVARYNAPCGMSEYAHAWPVLFIGGEGTETRLHQDHLATPFWIALVRGRKRFALAASTEARNLDAPGCKTAKNVTLCGPVSANLFSPDLSRHPRLARVQPLSAIIADPRNRWRCGRPSCGQATFCGAHPAGSIRRSIWKG
eukprot:TRINITY_DN38462_c0_g1_i1.p1 TRINITY_DN38462_c0_g1~~TRINITY_DN38462_c0_g1_i1.p1  ORF type:complete len:298 (+),score=27.56 TRINITY_DN38462_c0_g1_i1:122-1015(+)